MSLGSLIWREAKHPWQSEHQGRSDLLYITQIRTPVPSLTQDHSQQLSLPEVYYREGGGWTSRFQKGKWFSKSRSCLCAKDAKPTGLRRELWASTLW